MFGGTCDQELVGHWAKSPKGPAKQPSPGTKMKSAQCPDILVLQNCLIISIALSLLVNHNRTLLFIFWWWKGGTPVIVNIKVVPFSSNRKLSMTQQVLVNETIVTYHNDNKLYKWVVYQPQQ